MLRSFRSGPQFVLGQLVRQVAAGKVTAHLTPDELRELAGILEGDDRELIHEIARADHREFKHELQRKQDFLTNLQGKLQRNESAFSTEELETLRETLDHHERMLYAEISRSDSREFKHSLQQRLDRLVELNQRMRQLRAAA